MNENGGLYNPLSSEADANVSIIVVKTFWRFIGMGGIGSYEDEYKPAMGSETMGHSAGPASETA